MIENFIVLLGIASVVCATMVGIFGIMYLFFPSLREEIKRDWNRG